MKISYQTLVDHNACLSQRRIFAATFGKTRPVTINKTNWAKAKRAGLIVSWLAILLPRRTRASIQRQSFRVPDLVRLTYFHFANNLHTSMLGAASHYAWSRYPTDRLAAARASKDFEQAKKFLRRDLEERARTVFQHAEAIYERRVFAALVRRPNTKPTKAPKTPKRKRA